MAAKWKQLLVLPDLCRQNICSRLALEKLALDLLRNRLEKNPFFPMFLKYRANKKEVSRFRIPLLSVEAALVKLIAAAAAC